MNIKKIVNFCETFGLDSDDLEFYPGYKREIFMALPEGIIESIMPQAENFESFEEFEEAKDAFENNWWYIDRECFNVY